MNPISIRTLYGLFLAGVLTGSAWSDTTFIGNPNYTTPDPQSIQAQIQALPKTGTTLPNLLPLSVMSHQVLSSGSPLHAIDFNGTSGQLNSSATRRRRPTWIPVRRSIHGPSAAAKLTDTSQITQERLNSSSCKGQSLGSFLAGTNTVNDKQVAAKAIAKMDQWFPGWSDQLLALHMTIVISDHLPDSINGFCLVGDSGDQGMLLLNQQQMNSSDLGPVLWLAQSMSHEAKHAFNASWINPACGGDRSRQSDTCLAARRIDESQCLRENADTLRAASADPDFAAQANMIRSGANQQQFFADQIGRTNVPVSEVVDMNKYGWLMSAYWQAVRHLINDGKPNEWNDTLVSSGRAASSRDASPNASYTFEFALPDGHHVTYQFQLDETGPVIGPPTP